MIENQRYSNDKPSFSRKGIRTKNTVSKEAVMSKSIHSYFQLAKMIVTKVRETETQKQIKCDVGTIAGKTSTTKHAGFVELSE